MKHSFINLLFLKIGRIGHHPMDDEELKLQKTLLVTSSVLMGTAGIFWGALYFIYNEPIAALIPWVYAFISLISLITFGKNKSFDFFSVSQLTFSLLLPFALMIALGGFKSSSAVIIWSLTSPLGALVFKGRRIALYWFLMYLVLIVLGIFIENYYSFTNNLPEYVIVLFFALNIGGPSITAFVLVRYFVGEKNLALKMLEKKHKWIKDAFSSYISPNIVEHLIKHPDELKLGGERRECTFIFTDLVGFTTLVEQSDPAVLVSDLNEYFEGMTEIVFKHEGTVSKIVGDAIAVIFSAPVVQHDHAERAVACALAMDAYTQNFAKNKQQLGLNMGRTRIGVNTGNVIIGNMGSKNQLDYRALGDAINTAARLESANKQLGTRMCVSEFTVAKCASFVGRPIGSLILKGKTKSVDTYEPLTQSQLNSRGVKDYLSAFNLLEKDTGKALEAFKELVINNPNDGLAAYHLSRLESGETGKSVVLMWK